MEFAKLDLKNQITQSNDLIVSKYTLSLNEQRIIFCLTSVIQPEDSDFKAYKFKIDDIKKKLGIKNKNFYNDIKEAVKKLFKKTLTFNTGKWELLIGWLSSAEYTNNEWCIELCFDPKLKPYLLNLKKNFLSCDFQTLLSFGSIYTIRIFLLLLSQYKKYWMKKKSFIFTVSFLRDILQIEKDKYKLFTNFKAKVIEKAKKELELKHKSFFFSYKEIKIWRKITSIEFIIFTTQIKKLWEEKATDSLFIDELKKRLPHNKIDEYIKKYGAQTVENNFIYFKSQWDKWKVRNKENPTAYLITAIKNNYAWDFPKKELLKSKEELQREVEEKERKTAERKNKFNEHLKKIFKARYESLETEKKKELENAFTNHYENKFHGKSILSKIKDSSFKDQFFHFYTLHKNEILTKQEMDFDLWDKTQTLF